MDSLSQLVLGASCAAVIAPARHRRRALLLGAALGTLLDLDVLIQYADPVQSLTRHRGFSHSLFVLPWLGLAVWLALKKIWPCVREAPKPWLAAIQLALITHPLLDACTVFGTQLFWPLPAPPIMIGSIFIIDPLYTLPLLAGVIAAGYYHDGIPASGWLKAGLMISSAYLLWTLLAQTYVTQVWQQRLRAQEIAAAKMIATPTPFNSMLWRLLAMDESGNYHEGFYSLLAPGHSIKIESHAGGAELLAGAPEIAAVKRLDWFNSGFRALQLHQGKIVYTDLRMGVEPNYVFRFAVAEPQTDGVAAIVPHRVQIGRRSLEDLKRRWREVHATR